MAKLYFRYGAVGSAKTLNLLAVAHNYGQQNKKVRLLKPALDDRFGQGSIRSRAGLEQKADLLIDSKTDLAKEDFSGVSCILVDEAQFLSKVIIDQIRELTIRENIPAICYGLRNDFRSELFEGTKRLMEVSDSIEEVKSTCYTCNSKATQNLKYADGIPTSEGPVVDLGAEEKYHPACYRCYCQLLQKGREMKEKTKLASL